VVVLNSGRWSLVSLVVISEVPGKRKHSQIVETFHDSAHAQRDCSERGTKSWTTKERQNGQNNSARGCATYRTITLGIRRMIESGVFKNLGHNGGFVKKTLRDLLYEHAFFTLQQTDQGILIH